MRRKIITYLGTLLTLIATIGCSSGGRDYYIKHYLCDFEGEEWSNLIDSPQYMGGLLYSATPYSWYDEVSDLASDSTIDEYAGVYYWGGGAAVSNYYSLDYESAGTFEHQLTVCAEGAYSGKNCIVCTGYYTENGDSSTDYRPTIYLKSKRSFIESMMIANTTYSRNVVANGYRMADDALPKDKSIWIEAVGYTRNEDGTTEEAGVATFYLYKNGEPAFEGWKKWYITSLPMVDIVKFSLKWNGKEDNPYPAYFAIDDISVVRKVWK